MASRSPRKNKALIKSERKWDALFARRGAALERLADTALKEHQSGLTHPLNPETL